MDGGDTALLVGLVALGIGVAIGWRIQVKARQTRAAGAAPTTATGAKALASSAPSRFSRPIGGACGCPS